MYYHFTAILSQSDYTDQDVDRLLENHCDDGTIGVSNHVVSIGFSREANSLRDAIVSAVVDVQRAGLEVKRIEIEQESLASLAAAD